VNIPCRFRYQICKKVNLTLKLNDKKKLRNCSLKKFKILLCTKMNLIRQYNQGKMPEHKQKIFILSALHHTIRFVAVTLAIVSVLTTLSLHTIMSVILEEHSEYFYGAKANFANSISDFVVQTNEMRKARVLLGVFTTVKGEYEKEYRRLFRDLFAAHPKVCSLPDFKNRTKLERESCQLVYTFVVGGNTDPKGPTELLDDSIPLTLPNPSEQPDLSNPDVTFLNIR